MKFAFWRKAELKRPYDHERDDLTHEERVQRRNESWQLETRRNIRIIFADGVSPRRTKQVASALGLSEASTLSYLSELKQEGFLESEVVRDEEVWKPVTHVVRPERTILLVQMPLPVDVSNPLQRIPGASELVSDAEMVIGVWMDGSARVLKSRNGVASATTVVILDARKALHQEGAPSGT